MKILKIIKEKKLGLSFLLSFFILLIASLVLRNIFPQTYPISIFFVVLIFIFSQYFDFEYRYFIGFALALLVACPFLLIFKLNTLAEYFANYVYVFLVLGIVGYFFDNLREKLKSKSTIKIYKKVFLSILVIFLLSSAFIFVRDYRHNSDYAAVIKENFIKLAGIAEDKYIKFIASTKDIYIKTFKKDIYYSGMDVAEVDGKKISRDIKTINIKDFSNKNKITEAELYDKDIKIYIDIPNDKEIIYNNLEIEGWALDINSSLDSNSPGIDKIEIWLDGYPGIGKLLVEGNLNKERSDLVPVFGQQFLKAGYLYKVDINDLGKGKHMIFVFAHSIYSGWKFESVRIEVK
ncbi:MAG: hypothetical protein ACYDIA_12240 [Candidatus Humimicrobiaceae bacterium]